MNFYTSDCHFGHKKIIEYCERPFANVSEMNQTMIQNWNSVVSHQDTVYVLGDMFFYNLDEQKKIMLKLNGRKILILGNHDFSLGFKAKDARMSELMHVGWSEIINNMMIKTIGSRTFGLVHDPALCNLDQHLDFWLCGHIHTIFRWNNNILNVGVDVNGFTPVSENAIVSWIK